MFHATIRIFKISGALSGFKKNLPTKGHWFISSTLGGGGVCVKNLNARIVLSNSAKHKQVQKRKRMKEQNYFSVISISPSMMFPIWLGVKTRSFQLRFAQIP